MILQIFPRKIFLFLGHSLDKSDKDYINDIFKFLLKDYTEYSKIIVFYINQKIKKIK